MSNSEKEKYVNIRKKSLDESKKILNDNFYNKKIIESEKEKMKHKGNKILYQKLRNSMEIVKNPGLMKNTEKKIKNNLFNSDTRKKK